MIHDIGIELGARLASQGCPIPVVDGPEGSTPATSFLPERIVIERDESGDSYGPPRGAHQRPRHHFTRHVGAKVTIYVQSPEAGATRFEHETRAELVLELVLVALDVVIRGGRKNKWDPGRGKFVTPKDMEKSEVAGGASYEQLFTIDRSVRAKTFAEAFRPTATIGGTGGVKFTHSTSVLGDATDETPETACGA